MSTSHSEMNHCIGYKVKATIALLNNTGVTLMDRCCYVEAIKTFKEALLVIRIHETSYDNILSISPSKVTESSSVLLLKTTSKRCLSDSNHSSNLGMHFFTSSMLHTDPKKILDAFDKNIDIEQKSFAGAVRVDDCDIEGFDCNIYTTIILNNNALAWRCIYCSSIDQSDNTSQQQQESCSANTDNNTDDESSSSSSLNHCKYAFRIMTSAQQLASQILDEDEDTASESSSCLDGSSDYENRGILMLLNMLMLRNLVQIEIDMKSYSEAFTFFEMLQHVKDGRYMSYYSSHNTLHSSITAPAA